LADTNIPVSDSILQTKSKQKVVSHDQRVNVRFTVVTGKTERIETHAQSNNYQNRKKLDNKIVLQ